MTIEQCVGVAIFILHAWESGRDRIGRLLSFSDPVKAATSLPVPRTTRVFTCNNPKQRREIASAVHREVCNGGADLTDCSIRGRLSVRQRFISSSADRYHGVPPGQVGGVLDDVRGAGEEPVGGMPSPSSRIAAAAAWSPTSTSDGRSRPSAARSRSVTPKSLHALIDAQIFPVIEGIHSLTAR
jgi:hypothetical protein